MQDTVRQDREKYIGGSDIPAVLGISPFVNRFDLLMQKAQIAVSDFNGNEYTAYGEEMEPKIRDYLNSKRGWDFKEDKRIADDIPIGRRYHADGYSDFLDCVLEIKTTSQVHEEAKDYTTYISQLLFGMEMFDCNDGILAVYERPADFDTKFEPARLRLYPITTDEFPELRDEIEDAIKAFSDDLKALQEDPFLAENQLPSRKEIAPIAARVEQLEYQIVAYKDLEARYKKAKEDLRVAMKDNGIKTWTTNNGVRFTLVADGEDKEVSEFNAKMFAAEHPKLWKKYQVQEVRKGKKGYVKITTPKISSD